VKGNSPSLRGQWGAAQQWSVAPNFLMEIASAWLPGDRIRTSDRAPGFKARRA